MSLVDVTELTSSRDCSRGGCVGEATGVEGLCGACRSDALPPRKSAAEERLAEIRDRWAARDPARPAAHVLAELAELFGVSRSTARRIVDPEFAQRDRALSAAAKRRRRGVCERCGGETRYAGNGSTWHGCARLCEACGKATGKERAEPRLLAGGSQRKVLEAMAAGVTNWTELRQIAGLNIGTMSVVVDRLLKHDAVRRVARGTYEITDVGLQSLHKPVTKHGVSDKRGVAVESSDRSE